LNPPCIFSCVSAIFRVITPFFLGSCLNPIDEERQILSKLRLLRGHHLTPTPFGLIRDVVALLFFCRIMLNISESRSIVVRNLWQPCFLLCFPGILRQRISGSYSTFSGRAVVFIAW
jgi:hypothetical protein